MLIAAPLTVVAIMLAWRTSVPSAPNFNPESGCAITDPPLPFVGVGGGWWQVIPMGSISADVIETLRQEGYLEGEAL